MTSRFTLRIVDSYELRPYIKDLRALEASMRYPIDDGADHFTIDHGPCYHPFFSEMGGAKFLLLLEDGVVQGTMAGVWRPVCVHGTMIPALYLADLKLAAHLRGQRRVLDMIWYCIKQLFSQPGLGGWQIVYGAAMRGAKGDVMRAMKGNLHPAGLLDFSAETLLYFASPKDLLALPNSPAFSPAPALTNFSPDRTQLAHTTHGQKDFQLESTGSPWQLVHIDRGPDHPDHSNLGETLRQGAQSILNTQHDAIACFSVDTRFTNQVKWLESQHILPGATCTVYAMHVHKPHHPRLEDTTHIHIATSTI